MTEEEKYRLLLVDLCARPPYGVKYCRDSWNFEWDQEMSVVEVLKDIDKEGYINYTKVYKVSDIKPYLRPMTSMTKEEEEEWLKCEDEETIVSEHSASIDWLNSHHFDYRGLIEKGLAIKVTEENNPYNIN